MALDNAQFIAELSITDPPGTDPLSQGDDQIRTAKRAVFQSFPNIDAAVTLTTAQMNEAAIKNEANVFTGENTFAASMILDSGPSTNLNISYDLATIRQWQLRTNATTSLFSLRRFVGGSFVDEPWNCSNVTGVVDFAQVPTVQGAPLWIAGEIRMFAATATPGTNWFLADGTNGTVDLTNRAVVGSGTSSAGTALNPNLVGTAAAGTTGATALSEAQLPAHNHRLLGGNATGITDVTLGNVSNQTVVGANRGNTGPSLFDVNNSGTKFIEDTGSGNSHTHTSPSQAVTENGTSRDTVRPLSRVVEMHQYVP